MNKYLLMSAAALLANTTAAHAHGTHSFTFGKKNGRPYCDGGTITTGLDGGIAAVWTHTNNNCASGTSQGAGFAGKVKGFGEVWIMSDNAEAKNYGIYNKTLEYTFSKAIKTGAKWTVWIDLSGTTLFEGNSGKLLNVSAGADGTKSHGTTSTTAKVAGLVAAHRR